MRHLPGGGPSADIPTTLAVNPATSDYNVAGHRLGRADQHATTAPISGEPVTFSLNGNETCTGTTDSTGTASCSITPEEAQGSYPLTATFAGDTTASPGLLASNGSNTLWSPRTRPPPPTPGPRPPPTASRPPSRAP